jgi:hypothetical protein
VTSSIQTQLNGKQSTLTNPVTGTGTSGQVAYWSSGSAITGESNLFWDATNDKLGIGTNTLTNGKLVISDSGPNKISLTGGTLQNGIRWEAVDGANTFYLFNGTNNSSGFGLYNVDTTLFNFFVPNSGNFLINRTLDAGFKLDVNGTGRFSGALSGTSASFTGNIESTSLTASIVAGRTTGYGYFGNLTGGAYTQVYGDFHATKPNRVEISGAGGVYVLNSATFTGAASFNTGTSVTPNFIVYGGGQSIGGGKGNIRSSDELGGNYWDFGRDNAVTGDFVLTNLGSSPYFRIATITGAATFSNSVGVGGSPTGTYGKLSVFGGLSIKDDNNAKLEIGRYNAGVPNSYIKLGTNSNSLIFTNAADAADLVTFTNGGNVGIGTTNPTSGKLVVTDASSTKIYIAGGSSQNGMTWEAVGGAHSFYLFNGTISSAGWGIYNVNTGTFPFFATNGGNVLIGTNTTDNGARLQVEGTGRFSGKSFASGFTSRTGTISIASGVTSTITNMDVNGVFLVNIQVNGGSLIFNATNYFMANNTNGQYVNAGSLYDGANVTLSNSGSAIQITNGGFSTLLWHWSVFIMPYDAI